MLGGDLYERNNTIPGLVSIYADEIYGNPAEYFENIRTNIQDQLDYITSHYPTTAGPTGNTEPIGNTGPTKNTRPTRNNGPTGITRPTGFKVKPELLD